MGHPLEPLSLSEIEECVRIVKAAQEDVRFERVELKEPAKALVRAGASVEREARCVVYKLGSIGAWVYDVRLATGATKVEYFPGAKPMIQAEEMDEIEAVVKSNADFVAACEKRGVTDMELVCVDAWSSAGEWPEKEDEKGRHISHTFAWAKTSKFDNLFAHPIEGVCAVVDIKAREVLRVDDYGIVPVPWTEINYDRSFVKETRRDLRPIEITQPEGTSFKLDGWQLTWAGWSLTVGFNAREGLTLHDLRFRDRSVVYRASLAEMVVPYGTPEGGHYRKNVFDVGEYGIGALTNSLELGCDCLGAIAYLDGHVVTMSGGTRTIKNAVCIHEEDTGILWKHYDYRTKRTETRRGRRLVVSTVATVGNYEYGSFYYLTLDGALEFEIKATGIILG
ncbi:MAG: hypothetical protein AAF546_13770 [Verrucomicrobiota bacterium]